MASLFNSLNRIAGDLIFDAVNNIKYWRHNLKAKDAQQDYFSGTSNHPPVILLQGFMGREGVLSPLSEFLRQRGRDVITIDLGFFNIADIKKSASQLNYKIEKIVNKYCEIHAFQKIDIVAHSMGGLIALYYIKKMGGHRVIRKFITLGSPLQGTWVSWLGVIPLGLFSKSLWQMMPNSPFLGALHNHQQELHETEVISIAAEKDAICPPESCHVAGGINLNFPVGHAGLIIDSTVFNSILEILDDKHPEQLKKKPVL